MYGRQKTNLAVSAKGIRVSQVVQTALFKIILSLKRRVCIEESICTKRKLHTTCKYYIIGFGVICFYFLGSNIFTRIFQKRWQTSQMDIYSND